MCDGQNNTPDLRNRFVVGANTTPNMFLGNTGGANSVTLTVAQIPAHTHTYERTDVGIQCKTIDLIIMIVMTTQNTSSTGGGQSLKTDHHTMMCIL